MRYEMMFPDQIRKVIKENRPVVLPVGVLEYHSEHCVVGVDTLLVIRAVELLEKEMNLVILPPFYYGAGTYVVEAPENRGTVHVDSAVLNNFGRELFRSLLRIGFRNIHLFIHHQSENFTAGMPTDLAFKLAARQMIFEFLEKQRGEGWWGDNKMQDYYSQHAVGDNPFNWIQVHPFMDAAILAKYPIDHAGLQETSLMMAFCPEGVDMKKLSKEKWYTRQSDQATLDYGNAAKDMILKSMRNLLNAQTK
jgi:creatinine amidohydrolase/Fe(II)-dependent formamide hydrolase-like protein